ncbi:DNA-binding protein [Acinetobacter sp. Root1280]|uniref:ImmA/IrrE family metallo-endopeptidase n=1 Tax=Acinetobacter sp. Root1280 TaxID=1736444 RepID=UPI0006F9BCC6|nr:ImmA/IrrE family metallo-endopeptidase [Acinetobacter sp. Root1280]KQW88149.1 DNA-binding protein [Acinetobacter sp. Root1280]
MNSQLEIIVKPELLQWARETSGFSIADVSKKLKKTEQDVLDWENGIAAPTYSQLEKLAYEIYKRPLAVFFLPEPPLEFTPKQEFRTLPDTDISNLLPNTHMQFRNARAFQLTLAELYNGKNPERRPLFYRFELDPKKSVTKQADIIRSVLNAEIEVRAKFKDDDEALKYWISEIEKQGIFVFKNSFKQKEISGFCLNDDEFPIIYINNSTTKTRQIFSLLHELAHILLGVNGIGKFTDEHIAYLDTKEQALEIFCNKFASEVLIPDKDFSYQIQTLPEELDLYNLDEIVINLSKRYCVSREVVLRKFLDLKKVSEHIYLEKVKIWNNQIKPSGNGNWYATQNAYLSSRFTKEVVSKHYNHKLSLESASEYLGIKPKNFAGLEQMILKSVN